MLADYEPPYDATVIRRLREWTATPIIIVSGEVIGVKIGK